MKKKTNNQTHHVVYTSILFRRSKDTFFETYLENSAFLYALGVFQYRKSAKGIWSCYSLLEYRILKEPRKVEML